jgi:signal transduction histidine kinase
MGIKDHGILSKITRAFLFQGALIALAAILGVFFAKIVIEEILIRNAILEEADYFWTNYQVNPDFKLPDTKNLTGYFDPTQMPEPVRRTIPSELGFYEYDNDGNPLVLYLTREHDRLLYLLYYRGQVDRLVLYYGLFPLLTVLVILYLSLWLTYRLSQRTVSPIIRLARQINQLDFSQPELTIDIDTSLIGSDDEIQLLADAIHRLGERLDNFIARERDFTRDASHELRSPLTVINIAADMLESEQELSKPARNSVLRIQRAIADMQKLTEVFLMLAREDNKALTRDMVNLHDVLQEEVERARLLNRKPDIAINFHADNPLRLSSSDMVLSVLFGNLIRNSILYTDQGSIEVRLSGRDVFIEDSGRGMTQQQVGNMFRPYQRGENVNASGYGIGLTIVKRLTDRFHWPITVHSELDKGTRVKVSFPESSVG